MDAKQETKHTPGPWQFYADTPSTDPNWHIVTNASRMRVLANVHIEPGSETDLANARLIAAAPELLDALTELMRQADLSLDYRPEFRRAIASANAAICNATAAGAA